MVNTKYIANTTFFLLLIVSLLAIPPVFARISVSGMTSADSLSVAAAEDRISSDVLRIDQDDDYVAMASNRTVRTGRNPQTGKEIQIAAGHSGGLIDSMVDKLDDAQLDGLNGRATITIDDKVYHTNVKFNIIELPDIVSSSEYRCGVSRDDNIVCQVTPFDDDERSMNRDSELYCWGNNELRRCPDAEIVSEAGPARGGGAGKVSIQDIKINSKASADNGGEIEILSWSWGYLTTKSSETTDPDSDTVEMRFVWRLNGEYMSSGDDTPSETLSLSFTKIEMGFSNGGGSDGTILVELPEMRVYQNSLIFTEISFPDLARSGDGRVCGVTDHFLLGEDCDDDDPTIRPYSKADAKKALDGFSRAIDNIKSSLERCEDDVCRQVRANADVRKRLVERAIVDIQNTPPVVSEVRGIVEEDIAALERCRTDVCRDVLSQEKELLRAIDDFVAMASTSGNDWRLWIGYNGSVEERSAIPPSIHGVAVDNPSRAVNEMPDYLDVDDDGDGILTQARGNGGSMRASAALIRNVTGGISPRDISEDDKRDVREYLSGLEELRGEDLGLSIALEASGNERVRRVRFNEETNEVEVEHDEEVRLLGFIPLQVRARTVIDSEMNERTEYPWWSFLARRENKVRFKAGSDLSKSVN